MAKAKKTLEEVRNAVEATGAELLSTEYFNNKAPILVRCKTCLKIRNTTFNRVSRGVGCPHCAGNVPLTLEFIQKFVWDKYQGFCTSTEYQRCSDKLNFKCKSGHEWFASVTGVIHSEYWCKVCSFDGWTIEDIHKYAQDRGGLCKSTVYTNTHDYYQFECGDCGIEWECIWSGMVQYQTWCRRCSARSLTDEKIKEMVEITGEYTLISIDYRQDPKTGFSRHFLNVKCPNPKHEPFFIRYYDFFDGHRCAVCKNYGPSKPELELRDFIKTIHPDVLSNPSNILGGKRKPDTLVESLKVIPELLGLRWHSEAILGPNARLHNQKRIKEINDKGYRGILIFEDEWLNKQNQVKGYLRAILKDPTLIRVGARECVVEENSIAEVRDFLEATHIQGCRGHKAFSLKHNNEFIGVATFSKESRHGRVAAEEGEWKLTRYAIKIGYALPGGLERTLKAFADKYNPKLIYTYSDLRWSNGDVYKKCGFINEGTSEPDYTYFKDGKAKRYNKSNFTRSRIELDFPVFYNKDLTEETMTKNMKYYRIWDCGKTTWVLYC